MSDEPLVGTTEASVGQSIAFLAVLFLRAVVYWLLLPMAAVTWLVLLAVTISSGEARVPIRRYLGWLDQWYFGVMGRLLGISWIRDVAEPWSEVRHAPPFRFFAGYEVPPAG